MELYTFYIDDDRCAFPVRRSVRLDGCANVRERAREMLGESEHHRGLEVFTGADPLFKVDCRAVVLEEPV
jgi:hypothetical protein